jgi:hypothetical protein
MSEIALPAPKPPRSRLGTPRAALIDGDGAGADADVASVFVDDAPPPPQAATPALSKAIATRRAWDAVFSACGI